MKEGEVEMDTTKHDLCTNTVSLDYQALLQVSEAAYHVMKNEMQELMSYFNQYPLPMSPMLYLKTHRMRTLAQNLDIAAETLYTLRHGLDREKVKVINKPEVDKEN